MTPSADVAALLIVFLVAVSAASRYSMLDALDGTRCVDERFLLAALSSHSTNGSCVLVSFSHEPALDILCLRALRAMHTYGVYTVLLQSVGSLDPLAEDMKGFALGEVDMVLFLFGAVDASVAIEARSHSVQLSHSGFQRYAVTPLLGVVEGVLESADDILNEMHARKWYRTTVAVQRENSVTLYASEALFEYDVRCGKNRGPTMIRGQWKRRGNSSLPVQNMNVFPSRLPTNDLGGCVVQISPMIWPPYVLALESGALGGYDMSLMRYIAESKNVSLHVVHVDEELVQREDCRGSSDLSRSCHQLIGNRFWTGSLGYLATGRADIVLGGIVPTMKRMRSFEFSYPYTFDTILFYVEKFHRIERYLYPVAVLSWEVWFALGVTFVVVGVIFKSLLILYPEDAKKTGSDLMLLWGLFVSGRTAPNFHSLGTTSLIIFFWILFSMHFTSGYRAALAMADTGVLRTRGPGDIADLKPAKVNKIGYVYNLFSSLLKTDPLFRYIRDHLGPCNDIETCVDKLDDDPTFALMVSEKTMNFFIPRRFLDSRGRTRVHALREVVYSYHISLLMNRNSPISMAVNEAIFTATAFGLPQQWERSEEAATHRYVAKTRRRAHRGPQSLDLSRTTGHFAIIACGAAVSSIAFVVELLYSRWASKAMVVALQQPSEPPQPAPPGLPGHRLEANLPVDSQEMSSLALLPVKDVESFVRS